MQTTLDCTTATEMVIFYVGDILLGLPIGLVREINRHTKVTRVPQAPEMVSGVVNLRGEVATVFDLSRILGMGPTEITDKSRNVVIQSNEHLNGLLVDRVADILQIKNEDVCPPPANVGGIEGRFFTGVYPLERELVVILDLDVILAE
jgi:purine-binding chemotaxis protein CheW